MSVLVRARETVLGHVATVTGFARGALQPDPAPDGTPFLEAIEDPRVGAIPIQGEIASSESKSLVVIVHGLGGDITSPYAVRAARSAIASGHAALRVNMRGANGDGSDLYHAGLGGDLAQILASPKLARYERIALIGYSMGGHIVLRHAADGPHDPRLVGVVAVCPPIDLERGTRAIQRVDRRPYQAYILRHLRRQLEEVRARHPGRVSDVDVAAIRTIRDWDELVICPRFGFRGLDAYYGEETVGPSLAKLSVRTLMVVADRDPMIAIDTVEPWIARVSDAVTVVRKQRGGHVAFPRDVGLLESRGGPMEQEILRWIDQLIA
jgi:predicted alpha/beta-fold hydrolase